MELSEDSASPQLSRAPQAGGQAAGIPEPPAWIRKLFGSAAVRPYRLWQIHHIGICLRCALLVSLAWAFKSVTSGTGSLALFFSTFLCCAIQSIMAVVLLSSGSIDKEFLRGETRKLAPWLRAFGLANGALAMIMMVWAAKGHTILAVLMASIGIVMGVKALAVKPAMDRAAIFGPTP